MGNFLKNIKSMLWRGPQQQSGLPSAYQQTIDERADETPIEQTIIDAPRAGFDGSVNYPIDQFMAEVGNRGMATNEILALAQARGISPDAVLKELTRPQYRPDAPPMRDELAYRTPPTPAPTPPMRDELAYRTPPTPAPTPAQTLMQDELAYRTPPPEAWDNANVSYPPLPGDTSVGAMRAFEATTPVRTAPPMRDELAYRTPTQTPAPMRRWMHNPHLAGQQEDMMNLTAEGTFPDMVQARRDEVSVGGSMNFNHESMPLADLTTPQGRMADMLGNRASIRAEIARRPVDIGRSDMVSAPVRRPGLRPIGMRV